MNGGISETPAAGIGKLLMDNRFAVPNHQRDYSWTEDEVKQLFDDVEFALEKRSPVYFCGLVVFQQSPDGTLVVLDGQQRLATVLIIFSAIRSWLQQYTNSQKDAAQIQEWFIGRSELGETDLHPRLTMNSANDHAFNEYVIQSISPVDIRKTLNRLKKQDRNRRLLEATVYAHRRISDIAERLNSKDLTAKYLLELVKYLRDKVSVVRLTVSSESAAYTIFETLNDRGLDLSPLDLVKNHLFSKADEYSPARVRDMEERWAQMMSTLSNVRSDNFLKAFWTSRHGRIRTTDLFDAFKRQYDTADNAISLSMDLLASSEQYAALESSDDPVWASYSAQTRLTVRDLKVVGSQQAHPVILSALARLEVSEVERLLRLLEVVIVRYLLVGGGNTGRFETTCARLARSIFQGEVTTATAAAQELRDVYPSDEDFKASFRMKQERSNQKAHYFLRKLERAAYHQIHGVYPEMVSLDGMTVEHVLPRNPDESWSPIIGADPDLVDECSLRLGNMCLLPKALNRDAGRASFETKKGIYNACELTLTQDIATYDEWTRDSIDRHQHKLARLAASAWRFQ